MNALQNEATTVSCHMTYNNMSVMNDSSTSKNELAPLVAIMFPDFSDIPVCCVVTEDVVWGLLS